MSAVHLILVLSVIHVSILKYHGRAFKIPRLNDWLIVISGNEMVDDFRRAPEEYMSLALTVEEVCLLSSTDCVTNLVFWRR